MRMFTVVINGTSHHEQARGRTPEELQHRLVHEDGHKSVRVFEWIKRGARAPEKLEEAD